MAGPFTGNPFAGRFGTFQAAVNDPEVRAQPGGVQSYVWQDLRNYYLSRGEPLPSGAFAAVNQLLSLAGQQRRAQTELSKAYARREETGQPISVHAGMIAPHLDTRPLDQQKQGAQHRVVYLTAHIIDGQTVLSHQTHDFGYALPQSLDTLGELVESAAQLEAADYGYEWAGIAEPLAIVSY
jgi:hypothetical protein